MKNAKIFFYSFFMLLITIVGVHSYTTKEDNENESPSSQYVLAQSSSATAAEAISSANFASIPTSSSRAYIDDRIQDVATSIYNYINLHPSTQTTVVNTVTNSSSSNASSVNYSEPGNYTVPPNIFIPRVDLTTLNPATLSVTGDASFNNALTLNPSTPTNTTSKLYNNGGSLYWQGNVIAGAAVGNWASSGGNVYRATGSVGIGTTTPTSPLTVIGNVAQNLVKISGNIGSAGNDYYNATALQLENLGTNGQAGNVELSFKTKNSIGNVGIFNGASTSPTTLYFFDSNLPAFTFTSSQDATDFNTKQFTISGSASMKSITLPPTTSTTTGIIFKGSTPFIHTYAPVGSVGANTFIGLNSGNFTLNPTGGFSASASNNIGLGNSSLSSLTSADYNIAIGNNSLSLTTSGGFNTAIGPNAMSANTTGNNNVAMGSFVMASGTSTSYNTAIGSTALLQLTSGSGNSVLGAYGLYGLVTGTANTAIGQNTLSSITSGSNNIGIGFQAGNNLLSGSNNIVIGTNRDVPNATGSNQLNIGNIIYGTGIDGTGSTLSTGNIGIGTSSPYARLSVSSISGQASTTPVFSVASTTAAAPLFNVFPSGKVEIGIKDNSFYSNVNPTVNIGYGTPNGTGFANLAMNVAGTPLRIGPSVFGGLPENNVNNQITPLMKLESFTGYGATRRVGASIDFGQENLSQVQLIHYNERGGTNGGFFQIRTINSAGTGYNEGFNMDSEGNATIGLQRFGPGRYSGALSARLAIQGASPSTGEINALSVLNSATSSLFMVRNDGNVGIGIQAPTYKFQVNGEPAANGYTAFTNYSDARLKTNINTLGDSYLDKIMQLKPSTFNYNSLSGYDAETRNRTITGFVAQDLQNVFPNMVGTTTINGTEYLDTNLSALPIYLVKAIQELNLKVNNFGLGSSTQEVIDQSSLGDTFTSLMGGQKGWMANTFSSVNGFFKNIFADKITSNNIDSKGIKTENLCFDDVCLTKDEVKSMKALIQTNGGVPTATPTPVITPVVIETPPETATSTIVTQPAQTEQATSTSNEITTPEQQ